MVNFCSLIVSVTNHRCWHATGSQMKIMKTRKLRKLQQKRASLSFREVITSTDRRRMLDHWTLTRWLMSYVRLAFSLFFQTRNEWQIWKRTPQRIVIYWDKCKKNVSNHSKFSWSQEPTAEICQQNRRERRTKAKQQSYYSDWCTKPRVLPLACLQRPKLSAEKQLDEAFAISSTKTSSPNEVQLNSQQRFHSFYVEILCELTLPNVSRWLAADQRQAGGTNREFVGDFGWRAEGSYMAKASLYDKEEKQACTRSQGGRCFLAGRTETLPVCPCTTGSTALIARVACFGKS